MTFGEELALHRKLKGYTQKELARELHVYEKTVGNWERDKNMPGKAVRVKVCELLDLRFEDAGLDHERDLTPEEKEFFASYRRLNYEQREMLQKLMHVFLLWGSQETGSVGGA